MPQFHNNLYYPQLFDSELANFLSTKGLDVLLILSENKKPMRTVDLSIKLQKTSNIKISTDNYDTVKISKIIIKDYEKNNS